MTTKVKQPPTAEEAYAAELLQRHRYCVAQSVSWTGISCIHAMSWRNAADDVMRDYLLLRGAK